MNTTRASLTRLFVSATFGALAMLTNIPAATAFDFPKVVSLTWNGGKLDGPAAMKPVNNDLKAKMKDYWSNPSAVAVYCIPGADAADTSQQAHMLFVDGLFFKLNQTSMKPSIFVTKADGSNGYMVNADFTSPDEQARGGTRGKNAKALHDDLIALAQSACADAKS